MSDRPYQFEKNRYYYGKMLTSSDFQAEQRYNDGKRMFLNQMILGRGILCGLRVSIMDERTLLIGSGAAVDGTGREIVVPGDTVKKLSAFKGYDTLTGRKAFLYLRYKEETAQPVCVVNRKADQEEYEDNRVRETYEFFLADSPEETEREPEEDFFAEAQLLNGPDYTVSIKIPAAVCTGRRVKLSLVAGKLSDRESALSVSVMLRLPAFLTVDGKQELLIRQEDIILESGETKRYDYWLYAGDVEFEDTLILWDREESLITVDGEKAECEQEAELAVRLIKDTPEELARWRAAQRGPGEKDYRNEETAVQLAEVTIADETHDHLLEKVKESGIKRYISVLRSEDIREEYLSYYSGYGGCVPGAVPVNPPVLKKEEDTPSGDGQTSLIRGGTLEIPLDLKMRKGKICYSEEIVHGLGPGNVYIDVGILNASDGVGRRSRGDTVVYGDAELFAGKSGLEVCAQTAVKVFEEKGSFQVAARLTGEQKTIVLLLRWTAVKIPERPEMKGEGGSMQIVPEVSYARLFPGEKFYFPVRFEHMTRCGLGYEIMDPGGGDIDPDGVYTAPARPGVYEIRIFCKDNEEVCTYVYAVVGGER